MPYVDDNDDLDAPFGHVLFESIVFERKVMFGGLVGAIVMAGVFAIAIALPEWADITFPGSAAGELISVDLGIWGERRTSIINNTQANSSWIAHFPEPDVEYSRISNKNMPHFYRAQAAFSVMTFLLIGCATAAAFYSFKNHHHIFKRLTAAIYAIAGITVIVVIEVLVYSIDQWNTQDSCNINEDVKCYQNLVQRRMKLKKGLKFDDYEISYGFSYYLAWLVGLALLGVAAIFVYCSRRRHGGMAATAAAAELETLDKWTAAHRVHDDNV